MQKSVISNVEQGSQEWLALRKTKITATDASVIMGLIRGRQEHSSIMRNYQMRRRCHPTKRCKGALI